MAPHTLFVSNFPFATTEDEIRAAFASVCEVESVRIIVDRDTGRSRGYAFVEVADEDSVVRAVEALNESDLGGRRLVVSRARGRGAAEPPFRHTIVVEWSEASGAYAARVPDLDISAEGSTPEAALRQVCSRARSRVRRAAAGGG